MRLFLLATVGLVFFLAQPTLAQHDHGHGTETAAVKKLVERPRVFLDKSPRVVAYQLKRLNNERLLLVERKADDPKYAPVHKAVLLRAGMSPQYREEALEALMAINRSSATEEIVAAVSTLDSEDRQQSRSSRELASILLARDTQQLGSSADTFEAATQSENPLAQSLGYAGLLSIGEAARAKTLVKNEAAASSMLNAIRLVPNEDSRNAARAFAIERLDDDSMDVRRAATTALSHITVAQADTFQRLAPAMSNERLRAATVGTMLKIAPENRDAAISQQLVDTLVNMAEDTPADLRTTDEFINAMQLADQLFARIPANTAREYRKRLSAVTVRVVQIHTIEEEMRYDIPFFVVEAGRPVQVVLKNEDLMPHNLVITVPEALEEVAEEGLAVGPNGGHEGKQYVPNSDKVLFATDMVPPENQARLTFTAPAEPGDYPYVCTFPRHWMRMYGVMLVVDDLDAWLANPVEPKDPLGSNRKYVQSWTVNDFQGELKQGLRGRSLDIGKQLFTEATCAQCHKANQEGGAVGPDLNGVFTRWKGDRPAVLREILDPSNRIDPKYAVHLVITVDGETISGIVAAEDKKSVSMLANPESKELTVVQRDDIDEMVKTSTSMMPKGLLDRFTKDEVFEILAFLESLK